MKRFIKILIVLALALVLIPNAKALNKKVLTLKAEESKDGVITVSGTVEEGMFAVAIQIYDEKEENLITMKTASVDDKKFSDTINVDAAKYVVKVADYDGGDYVKQAIAPTIKAVNPKTYDGILVSVGILLISVFGIMGSILYLKRKKVKSN